MNGIMSPWGCRIFSVIIAVLLFIYQDMPASLFLMNVPRRPRCLHSLISAVKNVQFNVWFQEKRCVDFCERMWIQKKQSFSLKANLPVYASTQRWKVNLWCGSLLKKKIMFLCKIKKNVLYPLFLKSVLTEITNAGGIISLVQTGWPSYFKTCSSE